MNLRLAIGLLVSLGGCASTNSPAPCPQVEYRRHVCASGIGLVSYDSKLDLSRYCEPLAAPARLKLLDKRIPVLELDAQARALQLNPRSWLVLSRDPDLSDVPDQFQRWWREMGCVPPN